jgi:hypothetical protein
MIFCSRFSAKHFVKKPCMENPLDSLLIGIHKWVGLVQVGTWSAKDMATQ